MKSFEYTITDPVGIHARPAGLLVKEIKSHAGSAVNIIKGEKSVNALKLMALMQRNSRGRIPPDRAAAAAHHGLTVSKATRNTAKCRSGKADKFHRLSVSESDAEEYIRSRIGEK